MTTHLWIETAAVVFKDQLKPAMTAFLVSGQSTTLLFQVQADNNKTNISN